MDDELDEIATAESKACRRHEEAIRSLDATQPGTDERAAAAAEAAAAFMQILRLGGVRKEILERERGE